MNVEVDLRLKSVRTDYAEAPVFGPDLRDGVDSWSIVAGLGFGGIAPLSSSLQTSRDKPWAISGGLGIELEGGAGIFDLVEVTGVLGIETFGPDVGYFSRIAPSPGPTEFVFNEGTSGSMHVRLFRLGVQSRLTLARFGRVRTFAGIGYFAMLPSGKITHFAPATSSVANDDFLLTAELSGTAITPSAGVKVTVYEGEFQRNYVASDLIVEGRLDLMDWSTSELEALYRSGNEPRVQQAIGSWARALGGEGRSVSGALVVWLSARI